MILTGGQNISHQVPELSLLAVKNMLGVLNKMSSGSEIRTFLNSPAL